jgi:hypothetical protein
MSVQWSFLNDPVISPDQLRDDTPVAIRPMFYRTLGALEAE